MTLSAIVMMLFATSILWGGLIVAIWNISRHTGEEPGSVQRDL